MDCALDFLENHFLNLPWPIIFEILRHVPASLVYDPLLKVPSLRNLIIDQYYSKELHFILSPTLRPHFCTSDAQKQELIDIRSYGEIEDFLMENKDITPQLVKVITSQDFRSMELLLKNYEYFRQVPSLEFYIEKYELSDSDMRFLLSFANLHKLQTGRIRLRKASVAMAENFPNCTNLEEIVFLGHEKPNWSLLTFPPNLKNLDMSWYSETDVTSVNLPESVENLYWNQVGLRNAVFDSMTFPACLRTLMLTNNGLEHINVSRLPQNLTTIDLSNNNLRRFVYEEANPMWPPNLKSILLTNNLIDDKSLQDLSKIEWPAYLENLRLDMTTLTTLESLAHLPENLKYLDLSDTSLSSFQVRNNADDYPYFKFPDSLETLNMQCCRSLKYPQKSSAVVPPESRIRFPPNLDTLNMAECNIDDLSYFLFPLSLTTLSLSGNKITDLATYNYSMDGTPLVDWTQLETLRDVDFFYNHIATLENWEPPVSIRRIDLRRNVISSLTPINTPLFNEAYCSQLVNLHALNFEQNLIAAISMDLALPPNLTLLNLSKNELTEFTFHSAFISHANLVTLDISQNQLVSVSAGKCGGKSRSNLRELDLSRNSGVLEMTPDEFYAMLEQVGLLVTRRKHNLKSKHIFK